MTKRKSLIARLLLALVVLTLISFCFLGNTFARYAKEYEGSASVNVAKWDVSEVENATGTYTAAAEKLSPSAEAYAEGATRSNESDKVFVAEISNSGDVSAQVTFTAGVISVTVQEGADTTTYSADTAAALFTAKFYYYENGSFVEITEDAPLTLAPNDSVELYVTVVWTTDDANGNGDELDTWVGENVTSVEIAYTYNAVQTTQIPAAAEGGSDVTP